MCEPYHSIVQFHDSDRNRYGMVLGPLVRFGKRIKDFFHICKMGAGHSGAIAIGGVREFNLPDMNKWEVGWWDRSVEPDGYIRGVGDQARVEASAYAHKVSIGDLTMFRRFFEFSVLKTNDELMYFSNFMRMLNKKGQEEFYAKLKKTRLAVLEYRFWRLESGPSHRTIQSAVNLALGFTRKRGLLVPEWADDDRLWVPSVKGIATG